ncbi:MarR family winged helix-turn-helix transcriptional regulator [Solimonas terrae]|uniref:MarR family transcriptional regulator n=1 Tax=Solimonas terrae TaxID=1396819 RepID=A0A6M2BV81_9GAMM|nr:MarR family transcriptional regulator [Solimonas terrae]NGY06398.1 MarR family transcriptional regulator [Solimonas terrae]
MTNGTDRRLIYLLNVGQRRLNRWLEARLGEKGMISAAQAGALFYLARHDGASIGELAQTLDLAASAMTGLVDRMVRAGLLERRRDTQDGRAVRLHLSAAGRDALKTANRELAPLNARLADGFSDAEIDIVARWLASLRDKFDTEHEE